MVVGDVALTSHGISMEESEGMMGLLIIAIQNNSVCVMGPCGVMPAQLLGHLPWACDPVGWCDLAPLVLMDGGEVLAQKGA